MLTAFKCMLVACLVAAAFAQCPEDWNAKKCLGSSGQLATDPQLPYVQEKIVWHAGGDASAYADACSQCDARF